MIRPSINNNKERYREALLKCRELLGQGQNAEEIPTLLSSQYQEREIKQLLLSIVKFEQLDENNFLKSILRISLWVLLVIKLITIAPNVMDPATSFRWAFLILALGPFFNIISIILAYREYPSAYIWILLFGAFSMRGIDFSTFEYIAEVGIFDVGSLLAILGIVAVLFTIVVSFMLTRRLPVDALKVKYELEYMPK